MDRFRSTERVLKTQRSKAARPSARAKKTQSYFFISENREIFLCGLCVFAVSKSVSELNRFVAPSTSQSTRLIVG